MSFAFLHVFLILIGRQSRLAAGPQGASLRRRFANSCRVVIS
jgi:hypothetical protein